MRRGVWFALFAVLFGLGATPVFAGVAGAQVESMTTLVVRKVVVGTGTGPSTISATCGANPVVMFNFDTQGNPTTVSGAGSNTPSIVAGAWNLVGPTGAGGTCQFSETATGGATSTSWTCTYASTLIPGPTSAVALPPGCSAASGAGTGPVSVIYQGSAVVSAQSSDVTFTNTFVAPPTPPAPPAVAPAVVAAPTFTG
jgi:hypothetical protein